ncbi:MAG: hypothetical protein AAFX58_02125 [Pseudomonadota bacterium]
MLASGADIDAVLKVLRDAGYSKARSVKALVDLNHASLAGAKALVHQSAVWLDVRDGDDLFHDTVADYVARDEER